jgi:hypothetical protein
MMGHLGLDEYEIIFISLWSVQVMKCEGEAVFFCELLDTFSTSTFWCWIVRLMNGELERSHYGLIEEISRHFPGATKTIHDNPQSVYGPGFEPSTTRLQL